MGQSGLAEQFAGVLSAARAGADWAWARIYDSLSPSLLGYLRARGAPDPDGICGEVFCQLVREINRFEGDEAGFRSWVFVMAHHRLLDDLRRRRRRPEALADAEELATFEDPGDLETEVVSRATEDEIRALIGELTPAQRDVLLLRVFGGMKIEEVATAVGRRVGAVKALQRRGLDVLRRRLVERGVYPSGAEGR
jgi:RNA polymerase sigma-70 factor (ECF subfamily)